MRSVILVLFVALTSIANAEAATISYTTRSDFNGAVGVSITDDYENSGYTSSQSDAAMSAVLGETAYTAITFPNTNLITANYISPPASSNAYCAGCNGSFTLDFSGTSISTLSSVFGVALDVVVNNSTFYPYSAFVTFGDNSTQSYSIPSVNGGLYFFGITSSLGIAQINFGRQDTENNWQGYFAIDNLTIAAEPAAVPLPAALPLFAGGLGGLGLMGWWRRRKEAKGIT